jgi:hypothetical protein
MAPYPNFRLGRPSIFSALYRASTFLRMITSLLQCGHSSETESYGSASLGFKPIYSAHHGHGQCFGLTRQVSGFLGTAGILAC